QIADRPDPVLPLLELAVPLGGRERLPGLQIEIVRSVTPGKSAPAPGARGEVAHRRERPPALLPRRLAYQVMLRELGKRDRDDGDGEDRLAQRVQVLEAPHH